jgi:hypothetical protein
LKDLEKIHIYVGFCGKLRHGQVNAEMLLDPFAVLSRREVGAHEVSRQL